MACASASSSFPVEVAATVRLKEKLGSGAFAEVYLAEDSTSGEALALKHVRMETPAHVQQVTREVEVLSLLPPHPNVLGLQWHLLYASTAYLALSLCRGPTLYELWQAHGALGSDDRLAKGRGSVRYVFLQLCSALQHCHIHRVIHRDVKLDNVVVVNWDIAHAEAENPEAVNAILLDFGFSRQLPAVDANNLPLSPWGQMAQDEPPPVSPIEQGSSSNALLDVLSFCGGGASRAATDAPPFGHDLPPPSPDAWSGDENEIEDGGLEPGSALKSISPRHRPFVKSIEEENFKELKRRHGGGGGGVNPEEINRLTQIELRMSTVGNQQFVAPEMLKTAAPASPGTDGVLAPMVSHYGLSADAYSLGAVLRQCLTGVPPDQSVASYIADQEAAQCFAWMCKAACASGKGPRQYRSLKKLPDGAMKAILGLMQPDPNERLTLAAAAELPWASGE